MFHNDLKRDLSAKTIRRNNINSNSITKTFGKECVKNHKEELRELSKINELETNIHVKSSYGKIKGIAVKLSELKVLDLSIQEICNLYQGKIVIDAEFERLDQWLFESMKRGKLHINCLSQIIITVQVKRKDSLEQVKQLTQFIEYGLQILLVAGHQSYLTEIVQINTTLSSQFLALSNHEIVRYYGISSKFLSVLRDKGLEIENDDVLELQGYHNLQNSMVWTYYAGLDLTNTAIAYLSRRNGTNKKFICKNVEDLNDILISNQSILFIDSCCRNFYLEFLQILNKIVLK